MSNFARLLMHILVMCRTVSSDILTFEGQVQNFECIVGAYKTLYVEGATDASQIHRIAQNLVDIVSTSGGTLFSGPYRPENWKSALCNWWWATFRRAERQLGHKKSSDYKTDKFNWLTVVLWRLTAGDVIVSSKYRVTITVCDLGKLPFITSLVVDGPESLYDGQKNLFVAIVNLLAVGSIMSKVTVTQL